MKSIGQAKASCCALKLVADAENSHLWGVRPDPDLIFTIYFQGMDFPPIYGEI